VQVGEGVKRKQILKQRKHGLQQGRRWRCVLNKQAFACYMLACAETVGLLLAVWLAIHGGYLATM
jgi:hypothetical protein